MRRDQDYHLTREVFDPTRNDWPYPDDEDLTPDEREAYRAADLMGVPIDGVHEVDLKDWHDEDQRFKKGTRNLIQRLKRRRLIPTE
jgi:hypothetical protein